MKILLKTAAFGMGLLACTAFGFFWRDLQQGQPLSTHSVNRLLGVKVSSATLSGEQVFRQNYQRILVDFVKPVKANDLKYAGISGMMASLGDPHTIFLPPKAAQAFSDETRANFFGVGARLGPDALGAKAATVFEDGPAYAAGLRKGNVITAVDGKSVVGKDLDLIVDSIKGKEGTVVHLSVIQGDSGRPVSLTVRRARIIAPTVESQMVAGTKVGYLAISQFSEPTVLQFDRELAKIEANGLQGLVIDLRGNPGGLLETAAEMLSRFVEDKVVVTMRFRNGGEEVARTSRGEVHSFPYPVVLLVDQDSASAAEIFAGCLHDYGKATLVGTHTYGKASVQNVFPLVDQSSAKITIAKYFLPSSGFIGRTVDEDGVMIRGGLAPDVKAELSTDKQVTPGDPNSDSQLAKALEIIRQKQN